MKTCSNINCLEVNPQPLCNFPLNGTKYGDGTRRLCKKCYNEACKDRNQKWREKNRHKRKEYYQKTKDVQIEKAKKWYSANKEKLKTYWIKQKLKRFWPELSFEEALVAYENLLIQQNYSCAICQRHGSEFRKKLAIDHCHSSGKVRGLLCNNCNQALGKLKDNPDFFLKAIEYLNRNRR